MKWNECSHIGIISLVWVACSLVGIETTQADFNYSDPIKVPNINSPSCDGGARISPDGLELYFHSNRPNISNNCFLDIWVARRSSIQEPWSAPVKLDFPGNSAGPQGMPCISPDGLELYFSDFWPGLYTGACGPNPTGYGGGDLWVSTRTNRTDLWGEVKNLGPLINSTSGEDQPCLSPDGLSLYFMSARPGGHGASDLYVSTRTTTAGSWGPPVNLGGTVNGSPWETTPFISPDALSLFFAHSTAFAPMWVSRRATTDEPWGTPMEFEPVNRLFGAKYNVSFAQGDSILYFAHSLSTMTVGDYDIWQVEVNPVLDLNRDGSIDRLDIKTLQDHWASTDSFYDIAPIPLGDGVVDGQDLRALRDYLSIGSATNPSPVNQSVDIPCKPVLSWESSSFSQTNDIYFGTNYNRVKNATTDDASYIGRQELSRFNPGRLEFSKTYYWRVDEVNDVNGDPMFAVSKGYVRSFTVVPQAIDLETISVIASGADPGMEAAKTINGSGLNTRGQHSSSPQDMWLTKTEGGWIQYEFDKAYKLHTLLVWNQNQAIETFVGFGIKEALIETSLNGEVWTQADSVTLFAQAPGWPDYTANTTVDLSGIFARFVRITPVSAYGFMGKCGLSEVRFTAIPTYAREPHPADGTSTKTVDIQLRWHPGREAVSHHVTLGTKSENRFLFDTTNEPFSTPDTLDYGTTYTWSVTEVNEAALPSSYAGKVWTFTTPAFGIIDDFESYTGKTGEEVFATWHDGYSSDSSLGGSTAGHIDAPFVETTVVNSAAGSNQSMPLFIDNDGDFVDIDGNMSSPNFSEAMREFDSPQDWTASGVKTLSIMVASTPGLTGQLYCKINNKKLLYVGDTADLSNSVWQTWTIDLSTVNSSIERVSALAIGVEGSSSGILYIDDIHLNP